MPRSQPTAKQLLDETCELDADDIAAIDEAEHELDRGEGLDASAFLAKLRAEG